MTLGDEPRRRRRAGDLLPHPDVLIEPVPLIDLTSHGARPGAGT